MVFLPFQIMALCYAVKTETAGEQLESMLKDEVPNYNFRLVVDNSHLDKIVLIYLFRKRQPGQRLYPAFPLAYSIDFHLKRPLSREAYEENMRFVHSTLLEATFVLNGWYPSTPPLHMPSYENRVDATFFKSYARNHINFIHSELRSINSKYKCIAEENRLGLEVTFTKPPKNSQYVRLSLRYYLSSLRGYGDVNYMLFTMKNYIRKKRKQMQDLKNATVCAN